MLIFVFKTFLAAALISFVSWLSHKRVGMAGFLTALPLTTIIALAFSQVEFSDSTQSVLYAKSIFVAIPLSLLFFLPFLLATKFNLHFWTCFSSGLALLVAGYFIQITIFKG